MKGLEEQRGRDAGGDFSSSVFGHLRNQLVIEVHEPSIPRRWPGKALSRLWPLWAHCTSPRAAMETFCETVQFYLRHLEDSVYPVMTEEQFAMKLFPMYRYFVTVWLRNHNLEVRRVLPRRAPGSPVEVPQPAGLAGLRRPWTQGDGGLINGRAGSL